MGYNNTLAQRLRTALASEANVVEKIMFKGLTFMIDDKMCLCVHQHTLLCRIDPALHEKLTFTKGCESLKMKGRTYIGYVLVDQSTLEAPAALEFWVNLALDFNKRAKSSKKKR